MRRQRLPPIPDLRVPAAPLIAALPVCGIEVILHGERKVEGVGMPEYARLSSPVEEIRDHYTVVVVGSGYGGGIAASRLARAGQRVCVLERGKERLPGEFPRTTAEVIPELQVDKHGAHIDLHNGLFDMRFFKDINVLVGCGLGGTSLINANVSIRADPRVFEDLRWPAALRADLAGLEAGYRRAIEMLVPVAVPDAVTPAKTAAQDRSAAALGAPFRRTEVNVTFEPPPAGVNHVGVEQPACSQCGDCVTGCNTGAKNTTLMNYLPDAVNHGAEIYTELEVRRVSRRVDGTYVVHFRALGAGCQQLDAPDRSVAADLVILSAGTLGSTEILLRSRRTGLATSDHVGRGFTGNGDVLGFGYNCDDRINGIGLGDREARRDEHGQPVDGVGPCITSVIDLRDPKAPVDDGLIIEEGSLPGALGCLLPGPLALTDCALGVREDRGIVDSLRRKLRKAVSFVAGPRRGAMQRTQTYLVMGHERTTGTMALDPASDRVELTWSDIGDEPVFERIDRRLIETTRALGGSFVRNPLWTEAFHHHLITVHPLGGCVMADAADHGVVDHKGQVFCAATGGEVHDGLHVLDGSVIPRSLGCNPLLTISALTERACALIAADRGWTIDRTMPSRPRPGPSARR
jgi:cholesterol oxidase